ncbi:pentatricopeptide repeat-containing protein At1g03540-like [Actinidia eriantha]|uniref:pentatricopeptide repeat-containing protein At1g03540-like n=1 Tax=Actinidia eriantha TaxID=165200 RepID=UPI00258AC2D8|nr:pentatricopeptide repeat-containing protein At1g03540-like [Actinidia eriantha]
MILKLKKSKANVAKKTDPKHEETQNKPDQSQSKLFTVKELDEVDLYSLRTVLRACAGLAAVRQGKEVHCQYLRRGGWSDVIVESALVDLYAKCGCIDFAYRIFVQMPVRNLIKLNSMICGFAQIGRVGEALRMFNEMRTFYFYEQYGIKASIEHYNCMVVLLGGSGQIEEAEYLINSAEFKDDSSVRAALLGACSTSTNSVIAERIAKKMMKLEPDYHLSYVLLANVYRAVGRWSDALKTWRLMHGRGVKKMPIKSWI